MALTSNIALLTVGGRRSAGDAARMAIDPLTWVAASLDGARLAIGTQAGRVHVWDVASARVAHSFSVDGFVARAAWAPGGQLLVATQTGRLSLHSADGGLLRAPIDTGHGELRGLALRRDGALCATCGTDAHARAWDAQTLELRYALTDGKAAATAIGFAKDALVVGFADGYFVAWRDDGSAKLASGGVLPPPVYSLGVHPDGLRMVFGGGRGGLQELLVGKPDAWRAGQSWKGTPPKPIAVNALEFAADGRFVAACSDATALLFPAQPRALPTSLGTAFYLQSPQPEWAQEMIVAGACFVPETDLIATVQFDGQLRLWRGSACVAAMPLT